MPIAMLIKLILHDKSLLTTIIFLLSTEQNERQLKYNILNVKKLSKLGDYLEISLKVLN